MKQIVLSMVIAMAVSTTAFAQNKVKNVYASSQKLNIEMLQNSEQTVQLNRYFFAGYNTLCLPMTLTADQLSTAAKDLRIERFAGICQEGSTLNLYFVDCTTDGIQAGVPYLIYSPTAQYLRVKNNEVISIDNDLKTVRMSDGNGNTISFGSGWEAIEKVGRYGIPAQQNVTPLESVLVRTNADKKFLPTRCGFTWENQNPSATDLEIQHISASDVTAIFGINLDNADSNAYDLQGRKAGKSIKGLRIQNGKKTIVK
jgi:hypothetical protein